MSHTYTKTYVHVYVFSMTHYSHPDGPVEAPLMVAFSEVPSKGQVVDALAELMAGHDQSKATTHHALNQELAFWPIQPGDFDKNFDVLEEQGRQEAMVIKSVDGAMIFSISRLKVWQ